MPISMEKSLLRVLASFSGVALVILLGATIALRTNTIPAIREENAAIQKSLEEQNAAYAQYISTLEEELEVAQQKQREAEEALSQKLQAEERMRIEQARREQAARLAAQQEAARQAAQEAAEQEASSRESQAS